MTFAMLLAALLPAEDLQPTVVWRKEWPIVSTAPLLHEDRLLLADNRGAAFALDLRTGDEIWRTPLGSRCYWPAASDGERAYFADEKGITALKFDDGKPVWAAPLGETGQVAVDIKLGMVFTGGDDGFMHALDRKSGERVWKTEVVADATLPESKVKSGSARIGEQRARPMGVASDGKRVYLTVFDQGRTFGFNARDGEGRVVHQSEGWLSGTPRLAGDDLFIAGQDRKARCLDRKTLAERWATGTDGWGGDDCAADERHVFASTSKGIVHAFNRKDGKLAWKTQLPRLPLPHGKFATGVWMIPDGDRLWCATREGFVLALRPDDGKELLRFRVEQDSNLGGVALDQRRMYFTLRKRETINDQGVHQSGQEIGVHGAMAIAKPE